MADQGLRPSAGLSLTTGLKGCGKGGRRFFKCIEKMPSFLRRHLLKIGALFQPVFKSFQFSFRQISFNILKDMESVGNPLEQSFPDDFFPRKFLQSLFQYQKISAQVPAVHRRYIMRREDLEGLRVIPVVKVTPETVHFPHGVQGIVRSPDEFTGGDIMKITGREVCQKGQSDVCR